MSIYKRSIYALVTLLILLPIVFYVTGCNKPSEPRKAMVSGKVQLNGQHSHEGVLIFLFAADILSDEILSVNQSYPNLGFALEDHHIFDHREYQPLYSTMTLMDGSFTLHDVIYNKYIMAAVKDGYSPYYVFDLYVDSPEVGATKLPYLQIVQTEIVPQTVAGNFVFQSGTTYQTIGDVTFLPGSVVVFMENSKLLVSAGAGITFHGRVIIDGSVSSPVRILSGSGIENVNSPPAQFTKLELGTNAVLEEIHGLVFKQSSEGLVFSGENLQVSNCLFEANNISFQILGGASIGIQNVYIINSRGNSGIGLSLSNLTGVEVKNSLFANIEGVSLLSQLSSDILIDNCKFISGNEHVVNSFVSSMSIIHSSFIGARISLTNIARSNLSVSLSDVDGIICFYSRHLGNQINTPNYGWIKANSNNIKWSTHAVYLGGYFASTEDYVMLDFSQNYWNTTEIGVIENGIIDYFDQEPLVSPNLAWPLVQFIPIKTVSVPNAGVR